MRQIDASRALVRLVQPIFSDFFYATAMYLLGVIEAYPTNKFISDEIDLLFFVQFIHFLGED